MSDQLTGALFDSESFTHPAWWIGRVESKESWSDNIEGKTFTNVADIKGWGSRYKVRVFNWHTGDLDKVKPDEIPYMQVVMPVTAGSGHGGAATTPSIEAGSIAFGFFMDGMAGQEGYIVGLLGNSNNNVPKERGKPAPNQPITTVPPTSTTGGKPAPVTTPPPTPPTGPGSLANQPVPSNIDQLSIDQLKKLLDPSKTPSSAVFKAASEARQKARAAGLPAAEVERLVLAATVKASRQPGADAGGNANCNQGHQQFCNTYKDGSEERAAKVPDDRIIGNAPLSTIDALHLDVKSQDQHDKSSKIKVPLLDANKANYSDLECIQRTMANLSSFAEELKKEFNQVSALATEVPGFADEIQSLVDGSCTQVTSNMKNILNRVEGYSLTKLYEKAAKIAPELFPSEQPKFFEEIEKSISKINCAFNNIIDSSLPDLVCSLLEESLDKNISTPACAAQKLTSDVMSGVMDQILGPMTEIFSTLDSFMGQATGILGQATEILGAGQSIIGQIESGLKSIENIDLSNLSFNFDLSKIDLGSIDFNSIGGANFLDVLQYVSGIQKFFECEEPNKVIEYSEVAYGYLASPGLEGSLSDPQSLLSSAVDRALNPNAGNGFSDPNLERAFQDLNE